MWPVAISGMYCVVYAHTIKEFEVGQLRNIKFLPEEVLQYSSKREESQSFFDAIQPFTKEHDWQ